MKFTKESLPLIDRVLKKVDVYHINDFPYQLIANDVGASHENQINEIRTKWLFSTNGLYGSLYKHNNLYRRVLELATNMDYPYTLRQRYSIVGEMLDVDFHSNVPVHISLTNFINQKIDLSIDNLDKVKHARWIIHPGQTRAQASVFCRRNLHNVLLYIDKTNSKYFSLDKFKDIKKIENANDLLSAYTPFIKCKDYEIDFKIQESGLDIQEFLKVHSHASDSDVENIHIPILKAINFVNKEENKEPLHPSNYYLNNSFKTFNDFCEVFFNNSFKFYTSNNFHEIDEHLKNNRLKNFSTKSSDIDISFFKLLDIIGADKSIPPSKHPNINVVVKPLKDSRAKLWVEKLEKVFLLNREIIDYEKRNKLELTNLPFKLRVEKASKSESLHNLVEKNNFKGFFIFYTDDNFKTFFRDPFELLFFISADVTLSRSEDKKLYIVNCEHEYWKTGENYKEWKLTKEMYSE